MFQDGFGQRSLAIDQETGEPVEVLTFAPELAASTGFGQAVGERVAKLVRVRHAMYARVRRIERPAQNSLQLFSDRVSGWRLAEVLRVMEREKLTLDLSAVLALLRQLIPAVGLFSRHQRDAAIGTIGPERLILTPQGRLVLAEYALAPGLERLQYSRDRLWRDLRVAVPATASPTRMSPSADVVGIGVVALSLIVGRALREDEYLVSLGEIVESATESHGGDVRKLTAGMATWLARVLQFDEHTALRSPQEAQVAFEEMLAKERTYITASTQLDLFIEKYERLAGPPPQAPSTVAGARGAAGASGAGGATGAAPKPLQPVPAKPVETPAGRGVAPAEMGAPEEPAIAAEGTDAAAPLVPVGEASAVSGGLAAPRWLKFAAAVLAAVVVGEGVVIGWMASRGGGAASDQGELVVQSRPVAARVVIDGEERGITPFNTQLSAGAHVLEVRVGKSEPRVIPLQIKEGVQSGIYVELQSVATVGGLEVRSAPAKARVSVAGQYRGTTPLVLKDLPPGEVEVTLQSGGRQVRQTVRIEPGITSQLVVPLDR